jgi:hypothetical protein
MDRFGPKTMSPYAVQAELFYIMKPALRLH